MTALLANVDWSEIVQASLDTLLMLAGSMALTVVFGPKGKADYEAAKAAVPRWYRPEDREDLINDIVMMQLEGFEGDANEAFNIARARHNKLFDEYRDRPIDAVIQGTDRLRLSDVLSADHPHF